MTIPFFSILFNSCVVFDFPKGTQGAISLIDFNIVLLKTRYTAFSNCYEYSICKNSQKINRKKIRLIF